MQVPKMHAVASPRRRSVRLNASADEALHEAVRVLRLPATIRERCALITAAASAGRSAHFDIARGCLPAVAERVARVIRERHPDLLVPVHSCWRRLEAGGVARELELDTRLAGRSASAAARARVDLAFVSVLLDADPGPAWSFLESLSGQRFTGAEGLAVAVWHGFMAGRFSSEPGDPFRVDAQGLLRIDSAALAAIFQSKDDNALAGLNERVALLRRFGEALRAQPQVFTSSGQPGHLLDTLTYHAHAPRLRHHRPAPGAQRHRHVDAERILGALLGSFSEIWPGGQQLGDVPMGDAWRHPHAGGHGPDAGVVPLHGPSQWLAASLIEPFEKGGVQVQRLDELTALPDTGNGGLLIDAGVIVPRDTGAATQAHSLGDTWVVEWRALTVSLMDELAPLVRAELGLEAAQLPLVRLQQGSAAAARQIAAELREDGSPPVCVDTAIPTAI